MLHPNQSKHFVPSYRLLSDNLEACHHAQIVTKGGHAVDRYEPASQGVINSTGAFAQWTLRERPSETYILIRTRSGTMFALHDSDRELVTQMGNFTTAKAAQEHLMRHFDKIMENKKENEQ